MNKETELESAEENKKEEFICVNVCFTVWATGGELFS